MAKDYSRFSQEELIKYIEELQAQLRSEKYGLYWERNIDKEKAASNIMDNIPLFIRDSSRSFFKGSVNNLLIEGDNLFSLAALKTIKEESIDVIYIDPPYNTQNNDFVYNDKFVDKEDGYRHSKWLSFMETRLKLCRSLLTDDGLFFVSIDDNEQANLKLLCDQVFGLSNFVCCFIIDKTAQGANQSITFKQQHEYCLFYVRNSRRLVNYDVDDKIDEKKYKYSDDRGKYAITNSFDSINSPLSSNKNRGYTVYFNPTTGEAQIKDEYDGSTNSFGDFDKNLIKEGFLPIRPGIRKGVQYPWNWERNRFLCDYKQDLVFIKNKTGSYAIYHKNRANGFVKDTTLKKFDTRLFGNQLLVDLLGTKKFDYPKSLDMMKWVVSKCKKSDAVVLDFFAGSGTTGQAVLELNKEDGGRRRFILCTNNENNICTDVTFPRLKTVITGIRPDGSKYSDGIPANLIYYKTDFIPDSKNTDQAKYCLAEKVDDLLCISEDIFINKSRNDYSSHYASNDGKRHMFIYSDYFDNEKFNKFKKEVLSVEGKKIVYMFSLDNTIDETLFDADSGVELKPIPSKIYEIYKEIVEFIKRGE